MCEGTNFKDKISDSVKIRKDTSDKEEDNDNKIINATSDEKKDSAKDKKDISDKEKDKDNKIINATSDEKMRVNGIRSIGGLSLWKNYYRN